MPEQDDDRSLLLHTYRMTVVYVDLLELIALPTARRLAEADVESAAHVADSISAALGRSLAMGHRCSSDRHSRTSSSTKTMLPRAST